MEPVVLICLVVAVIWWLLQRDGGSKSSQSPEDQQVTIRSENRIRHDLSFVGDVLQRERNKHEEVKRAAQRSAARDIAQTDKMTGRQFEKFIADLYRDLGYEVELTPESGDQGADVLVTMEKGIRMAVQTKRYEGSVGNSAVQEAIAGRVFYHCQRAAVITNSQFTPSAQELAKKDKAIELINRDALGLLITRAADRQKKA